MVDTVITNYVNRLDCVEIDSMPDDVFVIMKTVEVIDDEYVIVKLLRNNDDHFLLIEQDDCLKFVIRKEEHLLDMLMSIETLNIGTQGL